MTSLPNTTRVRESVDELVLANKMLYAEGVLDAYGHVSIRHPDRPDRFLMSHDSPPVLATADRVAEYDFTGEATTSDLVASYYERYIHAAIYARRPDVHAICHNHTSAVIPFCAAPAVKLEIISHTACVLEAPPVVWDISDDFGSETDLMVTDIGRGNSLATTLSAGTAVLMRSHGSTVVGRDVRQMVIRTCELVRNARSLIDALSLGGEVVPVSAAEITMNANLTVKGSYSRQWLYLQWRVAQLGL